MDMNGKHRGLRIFSSIAIWYGVWILYLFYPWMQLNAKRTQIERKKNVPWTDSQIRKVSGNNFNPAMEPRTDKIVGTNNSYFVAK